MTTLPEPQLRIRVVIDANVFVSYLLKEHSSPGRAVILAFSRCKIVSSAEMMAEIAEVSGRMKFRRYLLPEVREAFLNQLSGAIELVRITTEHHACRDPKDNMVIDTAVAGHATYVITGDDDLLSMQPFHGVTCIKSAAFLGLF